jgi:hypothetical protein
MMLEAFSNIDIQENIARFLGRLAIGYFCRCMKNISCGPIKSLMKKDWEEDKIRVEYEENYSCSSFYIYPAHRLSDTISNTQAYTYESCTGHKYEKLIKYLLTDMSEFRKIEDGAKVLTVSEKQISIFIEIFYALIDFKRCIDKLENICQDMYLLSDAAYGWSHSKNTYFSPPECPLHVIKSNAINLHKTSLNMLNSITDHAEIIFTSIRSGKYDGLMHKEDIEELRDVLQDTIKNWIREVNRIFFSI